ncbi:C-X-C motif chemokine 9-like isoform X2 [Periophthalmus magnuspinnatus]|uniref:C-X-C motif chemokine 9-like isoform X2 n=1 Tax=Periophthalmus magnuspinnatus TaxID=409849 RepID=UPI002436EC39|nr:C-X-C motif chemokine 9-like isoform X2 [Periophthalmus magnuspinnatus]
MSVPMTRLAFFLAALAGVWVQIYQAQSIQMRCTCAKSVKYATNITDFKVIERRSGCDKPELVVTVAVGNNSTELCLSPDGKLAKAFFRCWEKNKNETRKHECIDRKKKPEK